MIEPKPFIEFLDWKALPEEERPTKGHCETHGEFDIRPCYVLDRVMGITSVCSACSKQYKAWKAEQEEIEYKRKAFESRLNDSGVTKRHFEKSFDNYVADTDEKTFALKSMKYFCDKIAEGECKNMILCGSVGTGKTHLCQASIRYLAEKTERNFTMQMATITQIIRYYRASWNKESGYTERDAIDHLSTLSLLIIDELGVQNGTESELNIIFEIINNRYENKLPTVIISNLEKDEVVNLLGSRIVDRLKEDGCRVLGMAWKSYRETNKDDF